MMKTKKISKKWLELKEEERVAGELKMLLRRIQTIANGEEVDRRLLQEATSLAITSVDRLIKKGEV